MESGLSTSSFSIDNILKPDKCDSSQEPRSADRALTLAERLAGKYCLASECPPNQPYDQNKEIARVYSSSLGTI